MWGVSFDLWTLCGVLCGVICECGLILCGVLCVGALCGVIRGDAVLWRCSVCGG